MSVQRIDRKTLLYKPDIPGPRLLQEPTAVPSLLVVTRVILQFAFQIEKDKAHAMPSQLSEEVKGELAFSGAGFARYH